MGCTDFDYGASNEGNKRIGEASFPLFVLHGVKLDNNRVVQGEAFVLEHKLHVVVDENDLAKRRLRKEARGHVLRPNVRANRTAEADAGWRRKDDIQHGLEPPDGGRRSGSGG